MFSLQLFRSDLISAMKLPDSLQMDSSSYFTVKEAWRREWEVGVQVCVSPEQMPKPAARLIHNSPEISKDFRMPPSLYTEETTESRYVEYDLDDMDVNWLEQVNLQRKFRALAGPDGLSEDTFREAIIALETKCQQNMACAVVTDETLGIEYDEETVCDVCRDRESEDTNDMIFCDVCNLCVHQACYGLPTIPRGRWLCKTCSTGERDTPCMLCLNSGGALKRVRPGNTNWAHLSCALWIPEVKIGNAEKMEPITNTEDIPASRWNLVCCVCRRKGGACVQCSHPHCVTAYHITCAFSSGLETHTRLDVRNNGVIHESYCPKHSPAAPLPHHQTPQPLTPEERHEPLFPAPASPRAVPHVHFSRYSGTLSLPPSKDLHSPLQLLETQESFATQSSPPLTFAHRDNQCRTEGRTGSRQPVRSRGRPKLSQNHLHPPEPGEGQKPGIHGTEEGESEKEDVELPARNPGVGV
ncbi:Protein Jade-3 [Geodia barretti]|uniref:Protein Jade-3 n=1 Tax=Geodia barretti TaxID=519541 RepID=A0AA35SZL4_GEOBA|nr:Protein Jade-3 [Geodia barretti]